MFLFLNINNDSNNFSKQKLDDIAEKYYVVIRLHCLRRLHYDKSYADDITQEVFELLYKKSKTIEIKNYRAWLYRTANNLLKDFYKKQKRKKDKETQMDEIIMESLAYEQNFEIIDEYTIERYKDEILAELTESERELFKMNNIEKLSRTQISEKLSISEENTKKRLYRLNQKIKDKVNQKLEKIK